MPRREDYELGAEVVKFEERARAKSERRARAGQAVADEVHEPVEPVNLAREATFRRLAELVRERDPVPPGVVEAAKAVPRWKSIDDELARLVYDSLVDDGLLSAVRSSGVAGRQLTFESPDLVLEVEVTGGEEHSFTCQVVPPQAARLEVCHRGGTIDLGADDYGTFYLSPLPDGPVSLRCVPSAQGACSAATSWVEL